MKKLLIALYNGEGSSESGVENIYNNITQHSNAVIVKGDSDFFKKELSKFDVIIFPGGSGSLQGKALGEDGRENIRTFLRSGGNYIGICAGAYLATTGFDWSLKILNAETISQTEWKRGSGFVEIEFTEKGKNMYPDLPQSLECRYNNGPIIQPAHLDNLPPFDVIANFKAEVSENGVTKDVMINTPAAICASYGKGKMLTISPHPENSPGFESFISTTLQWIAV